MDTLQSSRFHFYCIRNSLILNNAEALSFHWDNFLAIDHRKRWLDDAASQTKETIK